MQKNPRTTDLSPGQGMLTSNHGDPLLLHSCKRYRGLAFFVSLAIAGVTSASALTLGSGDYQVKVDTTLSAGAAFRVEEQAADLIGIANGGTAFSVNTDDGNLNYDQGLVSSVAKATTRVWLDIDQAVAAKRELQRSGW